MKIRTLEELSDFLDSEIAWRKQELSYVKSLQAKHRFKAAAEPLIRSGITLLYAHWEGFVKSAGDAYVHYVSRRNLRYAELVPAFVALGMRGTIEQALGGNRAATYVDAARFLLDGLNRQSRLPRKDAVSTMGNLSSGVLRDVTSFLGLDFSPYETKTVLIDRQLLHNRNEIAHGQYLSMDLEQYWEIHDKVVGLLETFHFQLYSAAEQQQYRRTTAP